MKEKIKKKIINSVRASYKLLDINKFIIGKTLCNNRCHLNAIQEAFNEGYEVLLVVCIGNNEAFVHFINQNNEEKYIDNTLGWFGTELYDYYLVRKINPQEYRKIWRVLEGAKKMLIQQNSNWFERTFKIIKEDDI